MNNNKNTLRVAVFGITRSGKDFSITSAVKSLNSAGILFEHFLGIPTVHDYSLTILNKEFGFTTKDEKGRLMDTFRKKISNRDSIPFLIQDEHYSFPTTYSGEPLENEYTKAKFPFVLRKNIEGTREYEVMFKEEWINDCDMVFYLNPGSKVILDRIRSSNGSKKNDKITEEDIELWKCFEIESLENICKARSIHFETIDKNDYATDIIVRRICFVIGTDVPTPIVSLSPTEECHIYEEGDRVERNTDHAIKLYKDASKRRYLGASYNLCEMCEFVIGVPKDPDESVKWYKCSGNLGEMKEGRP